MQRDYPILEFDATPIAVVEPSRVLNPIDVAEHCVLCFFQDAIASACGDGKAKRLHELGGEIGNNPIYDLVLDGKRVTVVHPGVGAPLAAATLEELIALGCRKFIACGGSGVLRRDLALGHIVVPVTAVRDEGTSYHYLPPGREVTASPEAVEAIESVLKADDVPYILGKTWTTDAVYRETPSKVALRRDEGCLTVEMEASAFFAVAQFRGVTFGQILYCGDDVSSDEWDSRHWHRQTSTREKLFWIAVEACLRLLKDL